VDGLVKPFFEAVGLLAKVSDRETTWGVSYLHFKVEKTSIAAHREALRKVKSEVLGWHGLSDLSVGHANAESLDLIWLLGNTMSEISKLDLPSL
jgi:hypothetical protein